MKRTTILGDGIPAVCRLGLATRGNTHLKQQDVEWAIERGLNYLNWCGHPDGLSLAVAQMGAARRQIVVAVQFEARSADRAGRELSWILEQLRTDYLDVAALYYVESQQEWDQIVAPGGAWEYLAMQKRLGRLRLIGLTTHQKELAAKWARSGQLDMLMIRYNPAHRGAEHTVFPVARAMGIPVVTFTSLRWKALLGPTAEDPPDFAPPAAVECYRFCLGEPSVAVALMAPGDRRELEQNVALLDDWRAASHQAKQVIREHGDRVRRQAGPFP